MNRSIRNRGGALLAALALAAAPAAAQVTLGQVDTFETGTDGWVINLLGAGNPPPATLPVSIAGGPTGNYLQLTALGGQGAGSRLNALNVAQWAGDYLGAGVGAIRMDVRNFGPSDLYLRLALEDVGAMGPTAIAFTTTAVHVPAGGDWTRIYFPILPGALTVPLGSVVDALTSADAVRLYHSQLPNVPNPVNPIAPVQVVLGVDNVAAITAIPEPSTVALLGGGLIALALGARRRARG